MKPIVVYYSKSGTTKALADRIAADLQCDTYQIESVDEYGNYATAVAKVALDKLRGKKANYSNILPDFSQYDVIIFGYPIWYAAPPAFAVDFMKNCNLDGKVIVPFATSGATPINLSLEVVRKINPNAKVLYPYGKSLVGGDNYADWIPILKTMVAE